MNKPSDIALIRGKVTPDILSATLQDPKAVQVLNFLLFKKEAKESEPTLRVLIFMKKMDSLIQR